MIYYKRVDILSMQLSLSMEKMIKSTYIMREMLQAEDFPVF